MAAPRINLGRIIGPRNTEPWPPCVDGFRQHNYAQFGEPGHQMVSYGHHGATRYNMECVVCGLIKQIDSGD